MENRGPRRATTLRQGRAWRVLPACRLVAAARREGLSFAEKLVVADRLYGRDYLRGFLELAMPQLKMHRQELARVAKQLKEGGEAELAELIKGHAATALPGDWKPTKTRRPTFTK
jgi:hypothetical protein